MADLENFVERHKVIRRVILAWWMTLVSMTTGVMIYSPEKVSDAWAAAYATLVGISALITFMYQWSRHKDKHNGTSSGTD